MNDKDKTTVYSFDYQGETKYFIPRETARNYIIKHLGKGIPANELFTPEVWTPEVLQMINEKCIKPKFSYGIDSAEGEVEQIFLNSDEDIDTDAE